MACKMRIINIDNILTSFYIAAKNIVNKGRFICIGTRISFVISLLLIRYNNIIIMIECIIFYSRIYKFK